MQLGARGLLAQRGGCCRVSGRRARVVSPAARPAPVSAPGSGQARIRDVGLRVAAPERDAAVSVSVEQGADETVFVIAAANRPGLLTSICVSRARKGSIVRGS
jgi:hypothetical protein